MTARIGQLDRLSRAGSVTGGQRVDAGEKMTVPVALVLVSHRGRISGRWPPERAALAESLAVAPLGANPSVGSPLAGPPRGISVFTAGRASASVLVQGRAAGSPANGRDRHHFVVAYPPCRGWQRGGRGTS